MKKTARIKPFLVLPLLQLDLEDKNQESVPEMPAKNPGLNLFVKTWPHKTKTAKKKDSEEEIKRPLTATLEKPTILDIRLMGKIDMSKIKKEFLNISNLCRMPLILKKPKCVKHRRPLSLPPPKHKAKKSSIDCTDSSWEAESTRSTKQANKKIAKKAKPDVEIKTKPKKCCDANNNSKPTVSPCRKSKQHGVGNIANESPSTKLPEPCKSCGRNDHPERFHSHPTSGMKTSRKMEGTTKIPVKSTVQKPVAIKYKSNLKIEARPNRKPPTPSLKPGCTAPKTEAKIQNAPRSSPKNQASASRSGSAKRTLTCYLCGREFGSASLPLHEPKCLQKWERENAILPHHLQRKPPPKPDSSLNKEVWDEMAWQSSQSALLPCLNCGRTFYPDRLLVHQRSCKHPQANVKHPVAEVDSPSFTPVRMSKSSPSPHHGPPPTFECYICGRPFGVNSIQVHEKQCLKKWNMENDSLPPDMQSPPPMRKEKAPESRLSTPSQTASNDVEDRPSSSKKPPLFPCYLCGKLFTVNSIYIHEPQCLKKWHVENDKLPPNRRRSVPLKQDIKFTRNGNVDFEATNEANWHSHLSQLIPCRNCSRTFNPDRIDVHERSCKGI